MLKFVAAITRSADRSQNICFSNVNGGIRQGRIDTAEAAWREFSERRAAQAAGIQVCWWQGVGGTLEVNY